MKIDYRRFYLYIGWNGVILALNFDFRGKNHDICLQLTHYGEEIGWIPK